MRVNYTHGYFQMLDKSHNPKGRTLRFNTLFLDIDQGHEVKRNLFYIASGKLHGQLQGGGSLNVSASEEFIRVEGSRS